jgi:hypothetical protein
MRRHWTNTGIHEKNSKVTKFYAWRIWMYRLYMSAQKTSVAFNHAKYEINRTNTSFKCIVNLSCVLCERPEIKQIIKLRKACPKVFKFVMHKISSPLSFSRVCLCSSSVCAFVKLISLQTSILTTDSDLSQGVFQPRQYLFTFLAYEHFTTF